MDSAVPRETLLLKVGFNNGHRHEVPDKVLSLLWLLRNSTVHLGKGANHESCVK